MHDMTQGSFWIGLAGASSNSTASTAWGFDAIDAPDYACYFLTPPRPLPLFYLRAESTTETFSVQ